MSNFSFLQKEFFAIHDSATKAEGYLNSDARAACWYARMTLEQMIDWLYRYDSNFRCYETSLGARVHEPSFRANVGEVIFTKATVVISIGNRAAHAKATKKADAATAIHELFHVAYWLARTYGEKARPNPALQFDETLVPAGKQENAITLEQLKRHEDALKAKDAENTALKEKLEGLDAVHKELEALRAEVAAAKAENVKAQDTHDYNEEQTRDYFIDMLLHEAGWMLDKTQDREYEVSGMPNTQSKGFVDYVLWGDDGLPLAVVEAKRTRRDARVGQQQAKLYADCLEKEFKRRPVIYYTNGYEHWLWDDLAAPPRRVQGFNKKAELELLMQRRDGKKSIALEKINDDIAGRGYQHQAIRSVAEAIEQHNQRRSLIVMATGSGKTRTVIALVDLLSRCNWVKRVLFLADRVSLVKQATKEFNKHLPNAGVVNLLDSPDGQGRVYVSTYPTMMNLINDEKSATKAFGVGHFDLVIVDEAHRSIYAKYSAIFNYFDSYLVGLTATPKDEIDHNTYGMFQLQRGVPTFAYALEDAIKDGYLVPPKAVSVPLKFIRQGIKYDELSEEEKEQWDEADWGDEEPPSEVDPAALNSWLFNEQTVDLVLEYLMTKGERVASGDRLGKTIIFAKNNNHAEYIAERFNINYPEYKGEFARVITFKTEYAQSLIDSFSVKDKAPHIAISVDMLDTGIDVPEVVNLVFFKLVRSKTKFWQMIGRGTRLCPNLYAPQQDKKHFYIFDFLQNLEYFAENPEASDGATAEALDTRLFKARLDLITSVSVSEGQNKTGKQQADDEALRNETTSHLHNIVSNMTLANMLVRPKRKYVEKYSSVDAWKNITESVAMEIGNELSNLPSQVRDTEEEAKRFDLLILRTQLCILNSAKGFENLKLTLQKIAAALELQDSIPAIKLQMPLIQSIATDEWWQGITVGMLESTRKKLRLLVKLIEKTARPIIYTQFDDELGEGADVNLPLVPSGLDYDKFKAKARDFLKQHNDRLALQKLHRNMPITETDLQELEKILLEQASGNAGLVDRARDESHGLGLFVRSLVGLDRNSAVEAMSEFLNDSKATSNQIEFVNMVVEFLTIDGAISAERLYATPFTALSPTGPDAVFGVAKAERLFNVIEEIRQRAVA
jgi:type I restriction enzyme R subunit